MTDPGTRFRFPREHGAWAMTLTVLAGSLAVAGIRGAPWLPCGLLAAGALLLFAASRWAFDAVREPPLRWAPEGWGTALAGLGALAGGAGLDADVSGWGGWVEAGGACVAALAVVTALRTRLAPMHPALLAGSSFVLSLPALLIGLAVFPTTGSAASFWCWPALALPAATLAVQRLVEPPPVRAGALAASLAPLAGLAAAAGAAGFAPAAGGLAAYAVRLAWKMLTYRAGDLGAPGRVRRLGWEQAAWSTGLALLWVWAYSEGAWDAAGPGGE